MKKLAKKFLKFIFVSLFWILVWLILARLADADYLLPTPFQVFGAWAKLAGKASFWLSALNSMLMICSGFIIGSLLGCLCAVVCHYSKFLSSLFSPLSSIIKATPIASFILLALVWMNRSLVPIFTSILIVMPLVWKNVASGIDSTDKQLLEMADCFKMKTGKKLLHIYLPAIKPHLRSALITGLGMAWKAGIAAEIICNPKNTIGYSLSRAKINFETPELFAWTLTVILLSFLLERLIVLILNRGQSKND